jgi:transposase InsO family protein
MAPAVSRSGSTSADQAIGRYIDGFYNLVRRHSALDFTSPAQFEKMVAD